MRNKLSLNSDWLFSIGKRGSTTDLKRVTLPHPLTVTPANSSGGRNLQSVAYYKRKVFLPKDKQNCRVLLTFEGAMGSSVLWVNDACVNVHRCGYTPFVSDITSYVKFGDFNVLEIEIDNRDKPDIPPGTKQSMLDFTYEGGIYRCAWITFLPQVHISDPILENLVSGGGVFVYTKSADSKIGVFGIQCHIRNSSQTDFEGTVHFSLFDEDNCIVSSNFQNISISYNSAVTYKSDISVQKPNLWSPETPYLYKLVIEVKKDNEIVDRECVCVGMRTFSFTIDKELVWNGESTQISGANYHAAWPCIGNAVPENLLRRDVRRLRGIGVKNIRSHYPFCEAFLDECDRVGMTVIVSNPGWQWFKEGSFAKQMEQNMREIIRWQRNHPCIILWEPVPNESKVPMKYQQRLHDIVKGEYPFSPCFTASDNGPTDVSYKMYDAGMLKPGMDGYSDDVKYSDKQEQPVWIREYGDWPDNWDDQNCAWRTPRYWGDTPMLLATQRMLGMDPQCQTRTYIEMLNNKSVCGYGIWPGIEHNRGYHINPCWGGFFDLFRLPKFTAWLFDSQQDAEEAGVKLYIANWWTDISPSDVTVFSNADKVKLYHDGQLVEVKEPENLSMPHPPFVFRNVRRFRKRDRSLLTAEAVINGKTVAVVNQKTPGVPASLSLETDLQGIPFLSGGNDIIPIYCKVTDNDGNLVPFAGDDHLIRFTAVDGCEIIGNEFTGANPQYPKGGIATVLIRSLENAEKAVVKAELQWPQTVDRIAIKPDTLTIPFN